MTRSQTAFQSAYKRTIPDEDVAADTIWAKVWRAIPHDSPSALVHATFAKEWDTTWEWLLRRNHVEEVEKLLRENRAIELKHSDKANDPIWRQVLATLSYNDALAARVWISVWATDPEPSSRRVIPVFRKLWAEEALPLAEQQYEEVCNRMMENLL